jgi:Glycosyl hydrolase catalytic core
MRIRARLAGLAATCCVVLTLTAPAAAAPLPLDFFGVAAPDSFDASPAFQRWLLADQKAVGADVLRQIFDWSRIEPSRGSYNWAPYDSFMTSTSQAGMDVMATVGWPAAWASRCPSNPRPWACPPTSYADFGRFVAALIGRYGPEGSFWIANPGLPKRPIRAWQLWNEPNLRELWGGAPNAAEYSEMLKAAAPYIRTADPDAEIVSAGVPNSYLSGAVPMTAYLEGMYAAGAQGSFDTLGLHIYCETPACSIGLVERARSIMNAYGDESAAIWVTEMGWASAGRASRFVTDLEGQAANIGEVMGELVARHEELGVRGLVQYAWHDASPQTNTTDSQWNHVGLTYLDYTHKPAWDVYRSHAIDTAPPETSIDSGPSGSGNGGSASFEFSSTEAGSDFACSLDGAAAQPCASPQAYPGLADGPHTFSATATDPHGNADPSPATVYWSVGSSPVLSNPSAISPPSNPRGAQPRTTLHKSQVPRLIRLMLRQKTNGRVTGLTRRCQRFAANDVRCTLHWRIGRYVFSGRARFVLFVKNGARDWHYTFKGTRKKAGCTRCRVKQLSW